LTAVTEPKIARFGGLESQHPHTRLINFELKSVDSIVVGEYLFSKVGIAVDQRPRCPFNRFLDLASHQQHQIAQLIEV
jgi:hypothetical protein